MYCYWSDHRALRAGIAAALATSALALVTTAAVAAPAASPAAAPIAPVSHLRLVDAGRAPRSMRVNIAVALNYRNERELEALIAAASDPSSPEYGHFLTPPQFASAFAPAVADYNRLASTLAQAGFTITRTSPTRTIVDASAPAAVAETFFNTVLHAVQQGTIGRRYANTTPASMPPAVRDITYGVAGLDNLIVAKAYNVRATHRADVALGSPLQGPDTGLSPFALAGAYDFPVQHLRPGATSGQTFDGSGHAAGVAIDSDFADSDVSSYLAYFKVHRTGPKLVRVSVDGGSTINPDGIETVLDLETIAGLAPGAALYVYLMPDLSTASIVDAYARVVDDNKVDVINSSFGGCEISGDNFSALTDHLAKQGAAQGITFAASSGDLGAYTCLAETTSGIGVSAPASNPHFTAVGGTELLLTPAGAYGRELAWSGSGGGVSTLFNVPPYQKGIPNVLGTKRNVPDIAFDADPGTGASLVYQGFFNGPIGGTSLSSPIFSALVTEYNETTGKRSGNINYALYSAFSRLGYGTRFRDITIGNNGTYGPGYTALRGYDDVTGIGSAIGMAHTK